MITDEELVNMQRRMMTVSAIAQHAFASEQPVKQSVAPDYYPLLEFAVSTSVNDINILFAELNLLRSIVRGKVEDWQNGKPNEPSAAGDGEPANSHDDGGGEAVQPAPQGDNEDSGESPPTGLRGRRPAAKRNSSRAKRKKKDVEQGSA